MLNSEVIAKQRAFERAYMFAKPFNSYVNGCSVQTASFLGELHRDLRLCVSPESLCLYVFLERPLPTGFEYPKEFDGMPVITRVVGEIRDEEPVYESKNETD